MKIVAFGIIIKLYESTAFLFMTSGNTSTTGIFNLIKNENPIPSETESQ